RQESKRPQTAYRDRHHWLDGRAAVHPADVQDRDGAPLIIEAIHDLVPWLRHLFADSAYAGDKLLKTLAKFGKWSIEIVRRMADTIGFEVLPLRRPPERAPRRRCHPVRPILRGGLRH